MKTLLQFLTHQLLGLLSNISDMLEMFFRLPFRQKMYDSEEQLDERKPLLRRIISTVVTVLIAPVALLLNLILLPFQAATVYSPERRRNFLWGLPAVAILGIVIFAAVRVNVVDKNINAKYRGRAQKALDSGNFDLAKIYYSRLVSNMKTPENYDLFNLAISLSETGDGARAKRIFDSLAPTGEEGFKPAHRVNALLLISSGRLRKSPNPSDKKDLKWHLSQLEKSDSPLVNHAWSEYYLSINEPYKALEHLKIAGKSDPSFLLLAADLCLPLKDFEQRQTILETATGELKKRLLRDPDNQRMLTGLANVLSKQEKFGEAEKLLKQSLLIEDNRLSRQALADFYILLFSDARKNEAGFEVEFGWVQKSIETYIYHERAYEKLVDAYQYHSDGRKQILNFLEEKLASGEKAAMVHFAMSNILWLENQKEDARWHVEKAYQLDSRFSAIANNLAWFLAHDEENPDLDRAYSLAHEVVRSDPRNPRFNDTLATILMKQHRWDEAVTHFQLALPGMRDTEKPEVHRKLAKAYQELNKPKLAKLHFDKSTEVRQ